MKYKVAQIPSVGMMVIEDENGILLSPAEVAGLLNSLEQRLADVEEELEVLDREIFVFASDVLYSKNAKNTDWLFDNAKAIYCRPRLGKGE